MTGMEHATEHAAKTLWDYDNADQTPEWRDMAWNDMGGSEPCVERAEYELRARALADAGLLSPAPEPRADLADAWDEGYSACNEYQNAYVPVPRPNPYRKGN